MKTGRFGLPDCFSEMMFRRYCAFGFKGEILQGRGRFAAHQRKVRAVKRRWMSGQRRAYQALNVCGVRIWVDKPRMFGGYKWRARRATVAAYCQ